MTTVAMLPQIFSKSPDAPAVLGEDVTPSDTVGTSIPFRALWVGTTGNVVVVWGNDTTSTFLNVPSGSILPAGGKRVNATGTTAASIVALF
jgi:hypothetical protein